MTQTDKILRHLRSVHGVKNDTDLMNALQDCGLVADECVNIEGISNSDLMHAYNESMEKEAA